MAVSPIPIAGDWDGDGKSTLGYYDPPSGEFRLSYANATGFADTVFRFGPRSSSGVPLVGDWDGDGDDNVGLYMPQRGRFLLRNSLDAGVADAAFRFGGVSTTHRPIAGDWNGDGRDSVGIYDQIAGKVHLRNALSSGAADLAFSFGPKNENWTPLAGDWNGDGIDTIGLHDPADSRFSLRESHTSGTADTVGRFGPRGSGWMPLAGDWEGHGYDGLALFDDEMGRVLLRKDTQVIAGPADSSMAVLPMADPIANSVQLASICTLTAAEVGQFLQRAEAASASNDGIFAVVDRNGRILGVRVEAGVPISSANTETFVFAIDGAVAKARTAAFFSSGDLMNAGAPLTSRTVRFISQTTITEREVNSNPNSIVPTVRGPGFVAPIGLGGHFPPSIQHTPPVDLFAIEHTNRDSLVHPGANLIRESGGGDDVTLLRRFNADPAFVALGQEVDAPESYGFVSGVLTEAQARGIATLPGGIPLYRDTDGNGSPDTLCGAIGVFFPGPDGYASFEQGYVPGYQQTETQRTNAPRVLEAEWIAFAAAGGLNDPNLIVGDLGGVPRVADFGVPDGCIDLVGIRLEAIGPHPSGHDTILNVGASVGRGVPTLDNSLDQIVDMMSNRYLDGEPVPDGWLVLPHDSPTGPLTAAQVTQIIAQGVNEALQVRAAIRLPFGSRTRMALSVTDTDGNVLGLFRMPDATVFSIDVAVAKARNTAYYADAAALQTIDQVEIAPGGPFVNPGVAFTNRTFRFVAEPRFPSGVDGTVPGDFSILLDPGLAVEPGTGRPGPESAGSPVPASAFQTVMGFDAFNPGSNFRDPSNVANRNGIVFFPGSTPLYQNGVLIGGFGVSGDGVDQDDVVTFAGAAGFLPTAPVQRADDVFVRGVRLPFIKFNRNPI